ncbi:MAG: glucose-6-phosphate isomerase [Oscillospiraceae bacterium]|jgi:glucose-6-phosphate isomerase|nr:glucose-6-phosphate isomerase [Oscillospiraceae bacterium]
MEEEQRLRLSTVYAAGSLPDAEAWEALRRKTTAAHAQLEEGTGTGAVMRGWLRFPAAYLESDEFARVQSAAAQIRKADALLVIGIGGSYLGARAVIEAVLGRHYNETRKVFPAVYFAGNSISAKECAELEALLEGREFYINVISKSGKTLEAALAYRHFRAVLERKYADQPGEAKRHIYATTDAAKGALRAQCAGADWDARRFVVPDDMGGRYSVLSAVGLLPIACAGVDIAALLRGAAAAQAAYAEPGEDNACNSYAALRYHFYTHGRKSVELFATYEPSMTLFGEWFKQLFGESEGKENKGLFPASVTFTTDLHSLGQYIQEGERFLFETVVTFREPANTLAVQRCAEDGDELNYLAGRKWHDINRAAFRATALAHQKGGCPSLHIALARQDAEALGWLIYFFEKACAISGYMLGVNPFDQPGVESYKNFMFALLGKAGSEETRAALAAAYGNDIFKED